MRIIFRILIILAVAVVVGGTLYAIVDNMGASASQPPAFENGERPEVSRPAGEFDPGARPERGEFDGGMFIPMGMLKSLAVIAIVSAVYLIPARWIGNLKKQVINQ